MPSRHFCHAIWANCWGKLKRRSGWLLVYQVVLQCEPGQTGNVVEIEFYLDTVRIGMHRWGGDIQDFGYLPAVYLIGKMSQRAVPRIGSDVLAMICGTLLLYGFGVSWLKIITGMPAAKALALGMYPFLIGDALKIAAAAALAKALRPVIRVTA